MTPLSITAKLSGPIALPGGPLAFDGLLGAAVAVRDQLVQAFAEDEIVPIEVPLQREPGGRFHLASFSVADYEAFETRYVNRRPVIPEAQLMGRGVRTMQISAGPSKGYRIPLEVRHLEADELRWWCIGDAEEIRALLPFVHHLGKRRAVGLGRVVEWRVEPCEPWDEGFPVVLDGRPLRPLPPDWPGLVDPPLALRTLTYPYWLKTREQLCAVPTHA